MKLVKTSTKIKDIKFANNNKQNTVEEYVKQCAKGEFETENVTVVKSLYFDSNVAYNNFSENLLEDNDFLDNLGNKDEAAAVYLHGELKFIVVTEGYTYARSVGLPQ